MNEQIIFDALRSLGLSVIGAAAFMGNIAAESGLVSYRLQGDFVSGYPDSQQYTDRVDSGMISRSTFINDGKGYGLCQWTYYTRKAALYDYAKAQGMSVGSLLLQLSFIGQELSGEFASVKTALDSASDLTEATAIVLRKYEMPADQSDNAVYMRTAKAQQCLQNVDMDSQPAAESSVTLGGTVETALTQAAETAVTGKYRITTVIAAENGEYKIKEFRMEKVT